MRDSGHDSAPVYYGLEEPCQELLLFCHKLLQPSFNLRDLLVLLAGVRWPGRASERLLAG